MIRANVPGSNLGGMLAALFGARRGLEQLPAIAAEYPDLPGLSEAHQFTHTFAPHRAGD